MIGVEYLVVFFEVWVVDIMIVWLDCWYVIIWRICIVVFKIVWVFIVVVFVDGSCCIVINWLSKFIFIELEFLCWFDEVVFDDDGNIISLVDFEFCKFLLVSLRIVCCFKNDYKKFFKELNIVFIWVVGKKSFFILIIV